LITLRLFRAHFRILSVLEFGPWNILRTWRLSSSCSLSDSEIRQIEEQNIFSSHTIFVEISRVVSFYRVYRIFLKSRVVNRPILDAHCFILVLSSIRSILYTVKNISFPLLWLRTSFVFRFRPYVNFVSNHYNLYNIKADMKHLNILKS